MSKITLEEITDFNIRLETAGVGVDGLRRRVEILDEWIKRLSYAVAELQAESLGTNQAFNASERGVTP